MISPRNDSSVHPRQSRRRQGFSLIELGVVLAISGILLGLLLPALYGAQLGAGKTALSNQLRAQCVAMHAVYSVYKKLPPACDKLGGIDFPATVHIYLLPFIEQDYVYRLFVKEKGKGDTANAKIPVFLAADDPSNVKQDLKGIQNFAANLRVFSTKGLKTKYDADMPALAEVEPGASSLLFPDGTSNTILFATKFGYCDQGGSRYAAPPNAPTAAFFGQNAARVKAHPSDKTAAFQLLPSAKDCCIRPVMAQSFYHGALPVGMADGSVYMFSPKVTPETWNRALQPNDGKPLGSDWRD
jgi:prepilin-type N-terminal cleavage/methylation domain-containing protein